MAEPLQHRSALIKQGMVSAPSLLTGNRHSHPSALRGRVHQLTRMKKRHSALRVLHSMHSDGLLTMPQAPP
jgi:hypothetical protein